MFGGFKRSDTLADDELKLVRYIERSVLNLQTKCTAELGYISDDTGISKEDLRKMIPDLVARGFLKCATENFDPVYCWIVFPEVTLPRDLEWCEPFSL